MKRCHIPEDLRLHYHHSENLKCHNNFVPTETDETECDKYYGIFTMAINTILECCTSHQNNTLQISKSAIRTFHVETLGKHENNGYSQARKSRWFYTCSEEEKPSCVTRNCINMPISVTTSVHLPTCNNSRSTDWVFMTIDLVGLY
jgi:hypothetical protein